MTQRDRLIELLQSAPTDYAENRGVGAIADHLISNGIIVPPCKVGDAVYVVYEKEEGGHSIALDIIDRITTQTYSDSCLEYKLPSCAAGKLGCRYPFDAFGKTVFLTCEEAKRALSNLL